MNYGDTTDLILRKLEEEGPMTRAELCASLGMGHDYVSAVLTRLSRASKTLPKRVHIVGYAEDAVGKRRYPRAVYAIGDGQDKKRPRPDKKAVRRRYEENKRKLITGASVFNLGMNRAQINERMRLLKSASD